MNVFMSIFGVVLFVGLLGFMMNLIFSGGKLNVDWLRLLLPKFMEKRIQGQVIKKQSEVIPDQVIKVRVGGKMPRLRTVQERTNYFVVFWVNKKQLGFNLTKIQYDMIQEREWYDVSYFKGRVFEYTQIEMPKEMKNDPLADYFKQENIELYE